MKKKQVLAAVLCAVCLTNMAGSVYALENDSAQEVAAGQAAGESSGETVTATPTPTTSSTKTAAPTSVAVKKANQAVDSAKEEKETMEKGLDAAKQMLEDLESMKSSVESHVKELDTELSGVTKELVELQEKLQDKIQEIENTQKDIEKAKAVEEKQYEDMKVRIKYMYEQGNTQYAAMLLGSESIADFLNKADYVSSISEYDRQMLEKYEATRKEIEELEALLVVEQQELEVQEKETKEKIEAIEVLVAAKEAELETVNGQIASKEQLIAEYEADIAEQNRVIEELEAAARRAAEEASKAGGSTQKYDGGVFAWPCPAYTRISSPFGYRMHPTLGVVKFHNGVDLAAPAGSAILAAYDGTVISAAYNDSMGNYVMINHGDGIYTIYMHASALYVSTGQKVSKGETIAAVGTTGRSTGNHLHFGVRVNGEYVDPMGYISK